MDAVGAVGGAIPRHGARHITSLVGVETTAVAAAATTGSYYICRGAGKTGASSAVIPGGGNGGQRWRRLATTPAAATERAAEDAGGGSRCAEAAVTDCSVATDMPAAAGAEPGGEAGAGGRGGDGAATTTAADPSGDGDPGGANTSAFLVECNKDLREYARLGEGEKAAALIARMREAGVAPTDRSYTSAINACKNGAPGAGNWERALALLRETATVGGGVAPNAFHYTAAMKACGNAKQWDQVGGCRVCCECVSSSEASNTAVTGGPM